jgi:hypothetical protein
MDRDDLVMVVLADNWVGMVGSQAGTVDTQAAMVGSLVASMVDNRVGIGDTQAAMVGNPVGMMDSLVVSKVDSQFDDHADAAYYGAFHSYSATYRFAFDSCS